MKKHTILLADDHPVIRRGVCALLQAENDFEVVGEAENGRIAVEMANRIQPDLIIMDLGMPQLNGLESTRQILKANPAARVLILTCHNSDESVHDLIEAGAAGHLGKETAGNHLVEAAREVLAGNAYYSAGISQRLLAHRRESTLRTGRTGETGANERLTSRETEVLQLVAEGYCNKQIAAMLFISFKTVEKHRQSAMNKLNIHETAGLTRYAIAQGIVQATPKLA